MKMLRNLVGGLFDEPDWTEETPALFPDAALSDLLPWRSYDPERRLYHFAHGAGFLFEAGPLIGASEVAGNLHGTLLAQMPAGVCLQVLNWSSPGISGALDAWQDSRRNVSALIDEMAEARAAHMMGRRFGVAATARCIPHERRVFLAGWMEGEIGLAQQGKLTAFRTALKGCFLDAGGLRDVPPEGFLDILSGLLHSAGWGDRAPGSDGYSPEVALNYQLPGSTLTVHADAVGLNGSPAMAATAMAITAYPKEWDFGMGALLGGQPERIAERPAGPVLTAFTARAIDQETSTGMMARGRVKLEHAGSTQFGRFIADFQGKKAEFDRLAPMLEAGNEKLFETLYTVVAYARGGPVEAALAAQDMARIYRRAGLRFSRDRYLQLPLFLASLPFGCSAAHLADFRRLMRMRLLKGEAVAGLAPLHGEWRGNARGPGMLLVGRQGQTFQWDNFVSSGNYNTAVIGKSGAGKSVFMQEMVTGIYASGGRVLVIDDGYSFQTTCEILGGAHIAFDGARDIRLNPFSVLNAASMSTDEYKSDAVELLTRVIATMAELSDVQDTRVREVEESLIAEAVMAIWDEKGPEGEVTDIRDRLARAIDREPRLKDVVGKLNRFARGGLYGRYFEGRANLSVDTPFTVVELSDIKSQRGLESVILQMVIFLGSELMFKTPRSLRVAIMIDEAWDLLKGDGTARFIEGIVRRARKYTGALITGTQSIDDYTANPASKVCLENSDFTVFLAQRPETVDRLGVPDAVKEKLKSLVSVPGEFSELAIKAPEGFAFGRLVLDPFSLAVFSSKGATVERLRHYREAEGMDVVTALRTMVARGEAL